MDKFVVVVNALSHCAWPLHDINSQEWFFCYVMSWVTSQKSVSNTSGILSEPMVSDDVDLKSIQNLSPNKGPHQEMCDPWSVSSSHQRHVWKFGGPYTSWVRHRSWLWRVPSPIREVLRGEHWGSSFFPIATHQQGLAAGFCAISCGGKGRCNRWDTGHSLKLCKTRTKIPVSNHVVSRWATCGWAALVPAEKIEWSCLLIIPNLHIRLMHSSLIFWSAFAG